MLSQEIFEQIHLYLSGQMDENTRADFEKLLQENPEMQEEFLIQKRIKEGLKAQHYKVQFQNIHQQLSNEGVLNRSTKDSSKAIVKMPWKYISIAASVVFLFGFWWFWSNDKSEISVKNQDSFAKHTKPSVKKPDLAQEKQDTSNKTVGKVPQKHVLESTVVAYEKYVKIPTISSPFQQGKMMGISPSSIAAWEADSSALLQNIKRFKQYPALNAPEVLSSFKALGESRFENIRQQAEWYEALANLGNKQTKEAKEILKRIASTQNHPYQSSAETLLKEIQKMKVE